jgi:hypothetical protein
MDIEPSEWLPTSSSKMIPQERPLGSCCRIAYPRSRSGCAKGACGPLTPDERTYVEDNSQHKTFHYTDVPIQQPQYKLGTAGTREDDVVQVSKQAINILRGVPPNQGPAVLDRKSLWVLDGQLSA